ncbi:uncharacterized protein LOC755928 [Strongylocentrotus purpuratus]|uniref:Uncharacterized protein n=1 Tax=Strongylocentrotus purpuratus TaxID=7668 RepID=A0A7M7PTR5_STRPU|nr:uncharacterized protein LOC755928 [Strongylocentrotus purpuratus]
MTVQTAAHTKTAQPPTLETDDGDDDDDDDINVFDSGTAFSSLHCETPIPPLPRARIPSRLGAVSAQPCEPIGEPLTSQGMMLIGKPANTAKPIRMGVSLDGRRKAEKGCLDTPSTSFLIEGRKMSGRITSLEEDLKPLLLCQSMGLKIETKPADFVHGTTAQIVFHCPRCLKHWKLSGMPTSPSECKEPHQPTRGPKYNISLQSHRIMKELEKLPEYSRQQLIKVLSRTSLLGADEELLELVNSVSSGFLQEPSTSPHSSRRSRSPEKRSAIRISKDRNSPSPIEKVNRASGLPNKQQRTRSANRKSGSPKTRKGATSAGVKSAVPDVRDNTTHHQSKQDPTLTLSLEEHNFMTKEVKHQKEKDVDGTIDKGEKITCRVREPSEEHAQVHNSSQSNLGNTQMTIGNEPSDNTGLIERIPNKPEAHQRIPSGETSATGQSIVEFEDIDGTRYHGFMSDAGNFIPIARVNKTGNRLPISMKLDGGICIVSRYGSQALDISPDDAEETQGISNIDRGIIEFRDRTGAIVRGYKNLSGQFVPVARIDATGVEHPVMLKTDGKFYVESLNNDGIHCDEIVDFSDLRLEALDETNISHPAVLSHSQTIHKTSTNTSITEVESHDGFKYQGFKSPKFGFIPTARIDPDGSRRPVVMNAEGEYTVVSGDGSMKCVQLQGKSDHRHRNATCTGCKFLGQSQSQSRTLSNASSSTLVDSSVFLSATQLDIPTFDNITQVDHWAETGGIAPPLPRRSSHKCHHMTYKRKLDGSIYHGCCQSGHFVPVFRLDEQGCRYPVLKDSSGKYYTIDKDGQSLYADEDEIGHTNKNRNNFVTRELNGYTFEGLHTIDGRFVPMFYLDDLGNRKAVTQSRNGQYIFSGRNGHINFVRFPGTDNEVNLISGSNTVDKAVTTIHIGDDGFKYEGYIENNGEFIPTVRIDKSGYRQMVLINEKYQGYVVGYNGEIELVPFNITRKPTKVRAKSNKSSHTPSGKSIQAKCFQVSSDHEGDVVSSAVTQSSHLTIPLPGSFSVQDGEVNSSDNFENDGRDLPPDLPLSDELIEQNVVEVENTADPSGNRERDHGAKSPVKETRISSGISLTSHHQDGTVIYREKSANEPSKDVENIPKLPRQTSHSGHSSKLEEFATTADSQEKQSRKSAGSRNNRDVKYLGINNDSKSTSFKKADGQVAVDMKYDNERDIKGKPIVKNTAVRNVAGRPDTKAGQFKKHVFATPNENITNKLANRKKSRQLDSQETASTNVKDTSEVFNAETKLPSLPKKPGLPPISQGEREANSKAQDTSSAQGSSSLSIGLPEPGPSDRAYALPPMESTPRERKLEKAIEVTGASENGRASASTSEDFGPEVESNQANDVNHQSQPPADALRKYSEFKLTVDPPISPPLLPQPPLLSDKEPTYRFTHSTLPSHLGSTSSPPPELTPVAQTFSGEQRKSPEPILFTKESSIVQVSTLPVSCDDVTIAASKVSSHVLMEGSVQPSRSVYRSGTSLANHSSSRMRGTTESMPDSVNKILQQHKRQVEFLRQNFHVRLTNAFSFSMFELPKQYEEHNSKMMQKAKQIHKMKKPTSLGKPPQIMLRPPHPLKKIPPPLQTIPYRIKAKISKA